jgi:hypothetical protein
MDYTALYNHRRENLKTLQLLTSWSFHNRVFLTKTVSETEMSPSSGKSLLSCAQSTELLPISGRRQSQVQQDDG